MSAKLGAVRYGTEHGDPFLGRTMGTQADYSHEVARDIDDEVRKLIEAAHTEAWEILTEYRDVLDVLAGELLEKETLHRAELEALFADVQKRPRLTDFDDFGGRIPSDKPPIKTPGELAMERGEPWPQPMPEPAFKKAIAQASAAAQPQHAQGANGNGAHAAGPQHGGHNANGPRQPDYGAPAGWRAPGWPPPPQGGHHYPPPGWGHQPQHGQPHHAQPQHGQPQHGQPQHGQPQHGQPHHAQPQHGQPAYPPHQQYPAPTGHGPQDESGDDNGRANS
jgi:cell division protease FtsH